jgi:uncharacterized membrane protein YeaQ/YmgE (transglycosylase-associated protein family)
MIRVILIGLVAGWLAGKLTRGRGFGAVMDIVLGLLGAIIGSWIFGVLGVAPHNAIGAIIMSTVGAAALVIVAHLIAAS